MDLKNGQSQEKATKPEVGNWDVPQLKTNPLAHVGFRFVQQSLLGAYETALAPSNLEGGIIPKWPSASQGLRVD